MASDVYDRGQEDECLNTAGAALNTDPTRRAIVAMAGIDESELKKIFKAMDGDNSGGIDAAELRSAMTALGIKVTATSAHKVLKKIDKDNNGTIEWNEFQEFFKKVSDPNEIKKLLSAQNQRFFEYKQMVDTDPTFAKKFRFPPDFPPAQVLEGHNEEIEKLGWISDTYLVSGSIDGDILIWDGTRRGMAVKPEKVIRSDSLYTIAATGDGQNLITGHGSQSSNLRLTSIASEQVVMTFDGHSDAVYSVTSSTNGRTVISGDKSGSLCIHDTTNPTPTAAWRGHEGVVTQISLQNISSWAMCTASRDGTVKIWDARSCGQDASTRPEAVIEDAAAASPVNGACWRNESEIITCGDDYCLKRWDIRAINQGTLGCYFGHTSAVRALDVSPDGNFIVSGTYSGSMRVWLADEVGLINSRTGEARQKLESLTAARAKQEDLRATGDEDIDQLRSIIKSMGEIEADIAYFEKVHQQVEQLACTQARYGLEGSQYPVNSLAWRDMPNGIGCVACGCVDQKVRLYDIPLRELMVITEIEGF